MFFKMKSITLKELCCSRSQLVTLKLTLMSLPNLAVFVYWASPADKTNFYRFLFYFKFWIMMVLNKHKERMSMMPGKIVSRLKSVLEEKIE